MNQRISVLLVDDHPIVREGYRRLLEESGKVRVTGEAAAVADAYQQFCRSKPDVVVMDLALPGVSGIEGIRRMLAHQADARVLVFSMHEDAIFARRALEAGAAGYLTKASAPRELVEAVEAVATGKRYISHAMAQTLAFASLSMDATAQRHLSAREFEVLELLVQGHTVEEIARQLNLNPKTVANHQSVIKQKLNVETAAQLVHAATRLGLVTRL
jgi:two-component system, NarL family, invasion response regulator UvrY